MKMRIAALGLLLIGVCSMAMAQQPTPEIDPANGLNAIAAGRCNLDHPRAAPVAYAM
jgi:hypothetical protein